MCECYDKLVEEIKMQQLDRELPSSLPIFDKYVDYDSFETFVGFFAKNFINPSSY